MKRLALIVGCLLATMFVENQATHAIDRQILRAGAFLEQTVAQTPLYFGAVAEVQNALKNDGWDTSYRFIETSNVPHRYSAGICETHRAYLIYDFRTCLSMVTDLEGTVTRYDYICAPTRSWTSPARLIFSKQDALSSGLAGLAAFGCGQVSQDGRWIVQINGNPQVFAKGVLQGSENGNGQ